MWAQYRPLKHFISFDFWLVIRFVQYAYIQHMHVQHDIACFLNHRHIHFQWKAATAVSVAAQEQLKKTQKFLFLLLSVFSCLHNAAPHETRTNSCCVFFLRRTDYIIRVSIFNKINVSRWVKRNNCRCIWKKTYIHIEAMTWLTFSFHRIGDFPTFLVKVIFCISRCFSLRIFQLKQQKKPKLLYNYVLAFVDMRSRQPRVVIKLSFWLIYLKKKNIF